MERSKHKLILAALLLLTIQIKATYRSDVYSAYINNNMDLWRNVIDRMNAIPEKDNELLLELVNYQYGYIGYCLGFDKKDEARELLHAAQKNLEILEDRKYSLSVINSYKSAFYGFRIALNPITAPVNGFKALDCARTALKLDPEHYLGYVQLGNSEFFMPSTLGGSKKEALEYFLEAKKLIEKNPESLSDDWNYLSLLIVIGQTYTYLKDYNSAQRVYLDILELEPGFLYVKDDLYPKLLNKMAN
jgi:tetratricopeptide (TPR) repeat protein